MKVLRITVFLVFSSSKLFAGDLGPIIHDWTVGTNKWHFGAVVFSHETYLVCGPFDRRFDVMAANVERLVFFTGLISASLAAFAIFRHRNRSSIKTPSPNS